MSTEALSEEEVARERRQARAPSRCGLDYHLARSSEERLGAFQLVHNAYVQSGLGQPNPLGLRATPYQILSTSQIFVGLIRGEVVSTVSLIGDGELGLPMETMFAGEVAELRSQGERLSEVCCLADRRQDGRRFLDTFGQLTRIMAQFARYEGIENLLITVHPRHARFYTKYLGFEPLSERVASCPHVQDRPAVALRLEFARIDRDRPACWDDYFATWIAREELRPYDISSEEMHFLRSVISGSEISRLSNHIKPEPVEMGAMLPAVAYC